MKLKKSRNSDPLFLQGASMMYAIFVMTIITIMCSLIIGLHLYRSSTNKQYYIKMVQRRNIESALIYTMASPESFPYDETVQLSLFNDKYDSIEVRKEQWGLFDLISLKSKSKSSVLVRNALCGNYCQKDDAPVLFLSQGKSVLEVSGETIIQGNVYVPQGYISTEIHLGKSFNGKLPEGDKIHQAGKTRSMNKIWEPLRFDKFEKKWLLTSIDNPHSSIPDSASVPFEQNACIYKLSGDQTLKNVSLKGHLVIIVDGTITIKKDATLEDIIVLANSAIIEQGFKGSLQIWAKEKIIIGEDCELKYPSAAIIYCENEESTSSLIEIGKNAVMNGYAVSLSESPCVRNHFLIDLKPKSRINGGVFSCDAVQIMGCVSGYLACKQFLLLADNKPKVNAIVDAQITNDESQSRPIGIDLARDHRDTYKIKWLK